MTIRQIRKKLPYWVEILNLREWQIDIRWGTKTEMADNVGLNFFSVEELKSSILLAKDQSDAELEHTLVHELLHLVYDGHKATLGKYDPMHERALNRTASALLALAHSMQSNA